MGMETTRAPLDVSRIDTHYWRVMVVDVTGSTQDDLVERAEQNHVRHGDVLVANYQSAGRGRRDREFVAPPSSALLFSFFLQPARTNWNWLPLLVGQSVARALSETGISVKLKWPNDIMISDKKVGGIIATRVGSGVVIGVGVNVAMTQDELPVAHATSLLLENFHQLDRTIILQSLLNELERNLERWNGYQDEELRRDYSARCLTLGKEVEIIHPDGSTRRGIARSIALTGELVLESGEEISVGDISHLR